MSHGSVLAQLRAEGPITAKEVMEGVTPVSNWVVPERIIIGAPPVPGSTLELLLDYGVDLFVDLRPRSRQNYLEHCTIEVPAGVDYMWFDMTNAIASPTTQSIADAANFLAGVVEAAILDQRVVYVHCADGLQTTATMACAALAFVYAITPLKAATIVSQQYACRAAMSIQGSLFTPQLKTVCRELSTSLNAAMLAPAPAPPQAAPQQASTNAGPVGAYGSAPPPPAAQIDAPWQQHQQQPAAAPLPAYAMPQQTSPPRPASALMKPPTMSPDHLSEREMAVSASSSVHGPPSQPVGLFGGSTSTPVSMGSRPATPASIASPAAAAQQQPTSQAAAGDRHGRFAHTRGHGGGQSQLNLFGDSSAPTETPTRRGGRATVFGHEELKAPSVAHDVAAHRPGSAMGHSPSSTLPTPTTVTAPIASANATPTANRTTETPTAFGASLAGRAGTLPPALDPKRAPREAAGPLPTTNWVVTGAVCCGAKPIPGQHKNFAALAAERFNCFVVLTDNDCSWEYLPAYEAQSQQRQGSCNVRSIPITDGAMVKGSAVTTFLQVVEEVAEQVELGRWKVYVHCDKGHGRTGLFVTALLWRLYGMAPMRAMNYCDALHSCRVVTEDQSSPQTQEQRTGIVTLLLQSQK